jgi:sterol desaturase/sphingolipid hydroxylase (fatty acid hydroxylase superfamily)
MIRDLLEYSEAIPLAVFVLSFFGVALAETFCPRQRASVPLGSRWANNIALSCLNSAVTYVLLPSGGLEALQREAGLAAVLWNPIRGHWILEVALGFLVFDFIAYWLHRFAHIVPIFWRLHRVHHSDLDVDVTTSYRHHPLEVVYVNAWLIGPYLLLGISWYVLATYSVIASAIAALQHGNVRLAPRWEALAERVLITTDMHRLHHSIALEDQTANYGAVFSIWDRAFGTHNGRASARGGLVFGLASGSRAAGQSFVSIMLAPLAAI